MVTEVKPNSIGPDKPIIDIDRDSDDERLEKGMALCLSGGGYRAMLFHTGALIRLNETGLLPTIKRVSSVSGGSIVAALLGLRWKDLGFRGSIGENFNELIVRPIRKLASKTVDLRVILQGLFLPGSIIHWLSRAYAKHLYGTATLQDLPDDEEGPRFVINASNIQSGVLWRFSKPYMGDYRVGRVISPAFPLAKAVAASSAFPPILSPAVQKVEKGKMKLDPGNDLHVEPYTTAVVLTDGGVYDNLGLETAWKRYTTILVSDGGGYFSPEPHPKRNWLSQSYRVLNMIDNQVRSLRKRQLVACYKDQSDEHDGAYWGIRSEIKKYGLPDALAFPEERAKKLAETATRLKCLWADIQIGLINWGYAICDAAIRKHLNLSIPKPSGLPLS